MSSQAGRVVMLRTRAGMVGDPHHTRTEVRQRSTRCSAAAQGMPLRRDIRACLCKSSSIFSLFGSRFPSKAVCALCGEEICDGCEVEREGQTFAFEHETCLISPGRGAAMIEGGDERLSMSVDLQGRDGPLFIVINLREPLQTLGVLPFEDIPLVTEGMRIYAPQPFELTGDSDGSAFFSLDITCPEAGS